MGKFSRFHHLDICIVMPLDLTVNFAFRQARTLSPIFSSEYNNNRSWRGSVVVRFRFVAHWLKFALTHQFTVRKKSMCIDLMYAQAFVE